MSTPCIRPNKAHVYRYQRIGSTDLWSPDKVAAPLLYRKLCHDIQQYLHDIIGWRQWNSIKYGERTHQLLSQQKTFYNWTKEMGLMTTHFNALSGTLRRNNNFIFGSSDGAIEFNKDMKLPRTYSSKMISVISNCFIRRYIRETRIHHWKKISTKPKN